MDPMLSWHDAPRRPSGEPPAQRSVLRGPRARNVRAVKRPDPLRWLWYAVGGRLPLRYSQWVLHDVTTRWWRVRALFRSLVQILPVAVLIYVFLPTEPWVRVMACLGGVFVGMIYALAYLDESSESRALKAGFLRGTAGQVRDERQAGKRTSAAARYAERFRRDEPPPATPRSSG